MPEDWRPKRDPCKFEQEIIFVRKVLYLRRFHWQAVRVRSQMSPFSSEWAAAAEDVAAFTAPSLLQVGAAEPYAQQIDLSLVCPYGIEMKVGPSRRLLSPSNVLWDDQTLAWTKPPRLPTPSPLWNRSNPPFFQASPYPPRLTMRLSECQSDGGFRFTDNFLDKDVP
jgi:hypothetical protein